MGSHELDDRDMNHRQRTQFFQDTRIRHRFACFYPDDELVRPTSDR